MGKWVFFKCKNWINFGKIFGRILNSFGKILEEFENFEKEKANSTL